MLDTLSVGLFAASGAAKALDCGSGVIMVFILGGITSVGGGALRDASVGDVPAIFKEGSFYALAGIGGVTLYLVIVSLDDPVSGAVLACIALTAALRYLSVYFNWKTNADPVDLTPYVSKPFKKMGAFAHRLFLEGRLGKRPRLRSARAHRSEDSSGPKRT